MSSAQYETLTQQGALVVVPAPPEVRVWRGSLNLPGHLVRDLEPLLDDERSRASDYRRADLRRQFIVRRALLRLILGQAMHIAPDSLHYQHGEYGKPSLPASSIHFNASHSGDVALFILSSIGPVGVDVEQPRSDLSLTALGLDNLTPAEQAWVAAAPAEDRPARLLTLWTRKEACAKSLGIGITHPLSRFEVCFTRHTSRWTTVHHGDSGHRLRVCDIDAGPDVIAAAALLGPAASPE